jgi:isoleucyl-tRNA synthetase
MTSERDTPAAKGNGRDWSETLFLPMTEFPMRGGLPDLEPKLLARWAKLNMYERLREISKGRPLYVLHDGPPYANAHIHIGTGLNKILKDVVARSQQMLGKDSNYVPGWDCHGLPIEWEIEKEYRAKGKRKDDVPINQLRAECRAFAQKWIGVQREEFKRLGVCGDWEHPYTTMDFESEARITLEFLKFAMNGALYRGSKPVMWSVVEQTALAEAEVEYQDYTSDTIFVKFPIKQVGDTGGQFKEATEGGLASIVIWTTTPWTIPGNRAVSFSSKISYQLVEVTGAPIGNWLRRGDRVIVANKLTDEVMKQARVETWRQLYTVAPEVLASTVCYHPLHGTGYDFDVPLLDGDHVTDDAGTGFVHTAPGHGADDFEAWMNSQAALNRRKIDTAIPFTVDHNGVFTSEAPGFEGKRVLTEKGDKGDANDAVIKALADAGMLIGRGRLKHQYPHSWRSKKPVIFRNTPQWFIAMDKPVAIPGKKGKKSIRSIALKAIADTRFVPPSGQNRLRGMIEVKPDWVVSRQRYWGVPLAVFVHKDSGDYIPRADFAKSDELINRIFAAFKEKGGDAWWEAGNKERMLAGLVADPAEWDQVNDTIEVWFDSGSTHAFCLEQRPDLKWPADLYLEGSDQHRGWFHSSLIISSGTRGRAPYDALLTHGFVMDEEGRKMSKSLGNVVAPQDVIRQYGADILRLWTVSSDFTEDLRIGKEILQSNVDAYRKIRNTLRYLLGNLAHFRPELAVDVKGMPELERFILNRLWELDALVRQGYEDFDFKRISHALQSFAASELSAFYFDIRKDTLYCEPYSSPARRACLTVLDRLFHCLTSWLAPLLCFTMEEAWLARFPSDAGSVHFETFPEVPKAWKNAKLAAKWDEVRRVRRVVTGALEIERAKKTIGSSLEASPIVHIDDEALRKLIKSKGVDFADVCITSGISIEPGPAPGGAFTLPDVGGVAVVFARAKGRRCARSWRISDDVGKDPEFPDISPRDAAAVREFERLRQAAE